MSLFGFWKKKKKQKDDAEESVSTPVMDLGIEQSIRKKKEEQREHPQEIVLEGYTPVLPPKEPVLETQEQIPEVERTTQEWIQILEDQCEQILEIQQQSEHAKIEYQAVTEYLSDVQKIERMEPGERKLLDQAAKKLTQLMKEREQYQKREVSTSHACFRAIRKNESSMMDELKNMREQEDYQQKIKNDLRQLEAEKAALTYDYERIPSKQKQLKQLTIALGVIAVSLFVLLVVLMEGLQTNVTIPFAMTVMMTAGVVTYIFYESYHNRYEYEVLKKKINRCIELLNKVKIKYINNTSALDYSYSKYQVKNSIELEYLMKEYSKAKEAERTYESNTDRVSHYREKILDILQVHEVQDSEIWLHQLSVLLDQQEFSDLQQNLEQRRQRLVDRMDENIKMKDQCFDQMHKVLEQQPQLKENLMQLLEQYHIAL